MSPHVKPQEKKKKSSLIPPSSSTPSFSLLPDEITVSYLARIPRPYYPRLSTVSKSFHSLLSSNELYAERSHLGSTQQCLYVSIREISQPPQWFTLGISPNQTLADSCLTKKKNKKKKTGNLLVPIPSTNISHSSVLVVGSEIYFIGGRIDRAPTSSVRILDCRTHTWRDAPSMINAREFPASCFYDGKIYVLGECKEEDEPWAEVFDINIQTWEGLPDPGSEIRTGSIARIVEIKGKIKFACRFGQELKTMYAYDPKHGKWEHCGNVSEWFYWSECVIDNVSYSCIYEYDFQRYYGPSRIWWYDIKVETWKRVKGLESFEGKHTRTQCRSDFGWSILVSSGGKLLLVWEECTIRNDKKIWCAVIKVEKRDGGEVWGKVDWDDVVHTVPKSHVLWDCLSVSV